MKIMKIKRTENFKPTPFYKIPMGNHKAPYKVLINNEWLQVWYFKYEKLTIDYYVNIDNKEIYITINPNTNSAEIKTI